MKKIKVVTNIERQILIGLIMSDSFIKKVAPALQIELLEIPAARQVCKWVFDYFAVYKRSPKATIQDIFNDKSAKLKRKEAKEWIRDFLSSISSEYEKAGFNEELLFNRSIRYFKRQKLKKNINQIEDLLDNDEVEEAEKLWVESRKIPTSLDLGFDPTSVKIAKQLLKNEESRISVYTGIKKLDKLVGPIKSGWLVFFMGPQKRGKTWALLCQAVSACMQGYNVVFISLESEDEDIAMRFWMMLGSLVSKLSSDRNKRVVTLDFPYYSKSGDVKYKKYKRKIINQSTVIQTLKKFNVLSPGKLIMKVFPMGSAGPIEIDTYLDSLEAYLDFDPHVILIDYLGIMKGKGERRDKYNDNSIWLKGLAQERKAAVFSGHQGRRETLEAFNINSSDMPEDIRILGNLDVLFGINQTEEERLSGITRISTLIHRHRKYSTKKQVQLLQQLEAGQFALDDKLVDSLELEKEILDRD